MSVLVFVGVDVGGVTYVTHLCFHILHVAHVSYPSCVCVVFGYKHTWVQYVVSQVVPSQVE